MEQEQARLVSRDGNWAVVHLPGRAFPGVHVQGDTFAEVRRQLADAARRLRMAPGDPDASDDLDHAVEEMTQMQQYYEAVLAQRGIRLPYRSDADGSPPAIVTLVCGASGVGKSHVAKALARRYGIPLAEVDDLVTGLKVLTTPDQVPMLHLWDALPKARDWTADQVVEHTVAVAEELQPGIEAVVADHVAAEAPVVIEGDYLLPDLVAGFGDAVRAVVISEPDEDQIVANYLSREPDTAQQHSRAAVSARFDAELTRRAARLGVPVVTARPWLDGADRADAALRSQGRF
jgi:2-phosphoglycerate kinase